MKDEDEKGYKARKILVDGEILHLIILRGEMEFEFAKKEKEKINLVFMLEFFFQL
jgi:hypothetical protein